MRQGAEDAQEVERRQRRMRRERGDAVIVVEMAEDVADGPRDPHRVLADGRVLAAAFAPIAHGGRPYAGARAGVSTGIAKLRRAWSGARACRRYALRTAGCRWCWRRSFERARAA